ncbi:ABC transporter substrate-binding protein [Candidatus Bipolaricaulota bacterium]|nr:ABC transporter substrate-binding protein [Candidatus Bipolaricaulota bacterium]
MRIIGTFVGGLSLVLASSIVGFAQYPISVTDDRGQLVTIESQPVRIVSLNALYAQIIVDLGEGERLIAVAESDDNPVEVDDLPTVGPAFAPNVEVILGLEPDMVLGANDWGGERPALEAAGVSVLTTPWLTSVVSIFDTIQTIAAALGVEQAGELLVGRIAAQLIEAEAEVLGKPTVSAAFLYAASSDDPPYAAGGDSIENELILRSGGVNVFAELVWSPQVSFEEILSRNPDVIFTAPSQVANITSNPFLRSVAAVLHGRVIGIRASTVASTQVADALAAIIAGLHIVNP